MNQRAKFNESTTELAKTLKSIPQDMRDALLALPAEEMYPQILMIHWGLNGPHSFPGNPRSFGNSGFSVSPSTSSPDRLNPPDSQFPNPKLQDSGPTEQAP